MSNLRKVRSNVLANTEINPVPGGVDFSKGRWLNLDNAGTRKDAIWPEGSSIKELIFWAIPNVGEIPLGTEYVIIGFDPANDALADLFLTQIESTQDDIQWYPIPINQVIRIPLKNALKEGDLNGGRIPAKTVGGVACNIWIGGK